MNLPSSRREGRTNHELSTCSVHIDTFAGKGEREGEKKVARKTKTIRKLKDCGLARGIKLSDQISAGKSVRSERDANWSVGRCRATLMEANTAATGNVAYETHLGG